MLDMIYINDQTKSLLDFKLEGKSFEELFDALADQTKAIVEISKYFESIIVKFAKTVEIPEALLTALKEKDLDDLLIHLQTDQQHLFTENFFVVIPPHMIRDFTDSETLRIYRSVGFNRYGVLIKSEDKRATHLAAADFDEFKKRFVLMEKRI